VGYVHQGSVLGVDASNPKITVRQLERLTEDGLEAARSLSKETKENS
jgi:hypothetical protein